MNDKFFNFDYSTLGDKFKKYHDINPEFMLYLTSDKIDPLSLDCPISFGPQEILRENTYIDTRTRINAYKTSKKLKLLDFRYLRCLFADYLLSNDISNIPYDILITIRLAFGFEEFITQTKLINKFYKLNKNTPKSILKSYISMMSYAIKYQNEFSFILGVRISEPYLNYKLNLILKHIFANEYDGYIVETDFSPFRFSDKRVLGEVVLFNPSKCNLIKINKQVLDFLTDSNSAIYNGWNIQDFRSPIDYKYNSINQLFNNKSIKILDYYIDLSIPDINKHDYYTNFNRNIVMINSFKPNLSTIQINIDNFEKIVHIPQNTSFEYIYYINHNKTTIKTIKKDYIHRLFDIRTIRMYLIEIFKRINLRDKKEFKILIPFCTKKYIDYDIINNYQLNIVLYSIFKSEIRGYIINSKIILFEQPHFENMIIIDSIKNHNWFDFQIMKMNGLENYGR
jgi:hypothetical protein